MKQDFEQKLPDRVMEWVIDSLGKQASIESVQRLHGGISSTVHCVHVRVNGAQQDFVVRQFDNVAWLNEEPDLVRHEVASLRWATRADVPTPEMVSSAETGYECGVPVVLMTCLKGQVELKPLHVNEWLDGLAESLVRIHEVKPDGFPWAYFSYNDITSLNVPEWTNVPRAWNRAIDVITGQRPNYKECFIHRDYHPTNVLWAQSAVSGVVDWVNACRGPAGIDVGHCRVNLAQLFGVAIADDFLAAYQRHAGSTFVYDPYWDLVSLMDILSGPLIVYPGWTALGVTHLSNQLMAQRLDTYLHSLLIR